MEKLVVAASWNFSANRSLFLGDRSLAEELAELVVPLTLADGESSSQRERAYGSLFHPRRKMQVSIKGGNKARG